MLNKNVRVIGVPLDLGANIRGANIGPSSIRIAELRPKLQVLGFEVHDMGDLEVPVRETLPPAAEKQKYLEQIAQVCDKLHQCVYEGMKQKEIPITLGGDHSIAMGSISGASKFYAEKGEKLGLIWIDAHADLNTPTSSPSGNIHGMPLSVVLGNGFDRLTKIGGEAAKVAPENVALVGIRTLDAEEKQICKESGIRYFTMREIDERGMAAVMRDAVAVASKGTAALHLSVDLDGIDPLYAPGVSTPVTGGLSYREAHLALEMIADSGKLCSLDIVELNPMRDISHQTALLAIELIQSALGKSIV